MSKIILIASLIFAVMLLGSFLSSNSKGAQFLQTEKTVTENNKQQSIQLTLSNNMKIQALEGCEVLDGFNLLAGCTESPFEENTESMTQRPVSSVKIQSHILSNFNSINEILSNKAKAFGIQWGEVKSSKNIHIEDSANARTWILTDIRTKYSSSFQSTRNLALKQSAMDLFTTNPESFMKKYGQMFITGFTTGAWFDGYLTIKSDDPTILNKVVDMLGNEPDKQEIINKIKTQYGANVQITVNIQSSLKISNTNSLQEAHIEFQNIFTKITDEDKVTLLLSNYDSLTSVMKEYRNFPQETKDYITKIKKISDRTLMKITESLEIYKILLAQIESVLEVKYDQNMTIIVKQDLQKVKDLQQVIMKNQKEIKEISLEKIMEFDREGGAALEYELLVAQTNGFIEDLQTKVKDEFERRRIEEEKRKAEEERKRKEEEERKRKEEEERKKKQHLILNGTKEEKLEMNKNETRYIKFDYILSLKNRSSVIIDFNKMVGQMQIFASIDNKFPNSTKYDYLYETNVHWWGGEEKIDFSVLPFLNTTNKNATTFIPLYLGIYALKDSSFEVNAFLE